MRFTFIDDEEDETSPADSAGGGTPTMAALPLREANNNQQQEQQSNATKKVMFTSSTMIGEKNMKKTESNSSKRKRQGTPFKVQGSSGLTADISTTGMELEDTSEATEKILQAADEAFNQMQIIEETTEKEQQRRLETDDFPDEGLLPSASTSAVAGGRPASWRFQLQTEDIMKASDSKIMGSITDRLTKSVAGSKTTSSSTDFGLRMGRTFRVGWGSDGTFMSIGKNGRITRMKPVFSSSPSATGSNDVAISNDVNQVLLQTQMQRSRKLSVPGIKCPVFAIDSRKSGQVDVLEETLEKLAESSLDAESRDSFMLLNVLRQQFLSSATKDDDETQRRIIGAITQWLVDSTADEVETEVSTSRLNHDPVGMILSAVSGGNLRKAASVAEQNGYNDLAVLLSSSGKDDIKRELDQWSKNGINAKIPKKLLRTYHVIAGNETLENATFQRKDANPAFDWRRRMLIDLVYSSTHGKNLADILQDYEVKITEQKAPFPVPRYMGYDMLSSKEKTESVLYKLLEYGAESPSLDNTATIFDPLGYGPNPHDFGLAFGLASCMNALPKTKQAPNGCLNSKESRELVDGFAANLIAAGRWEIAVWVSLNCLSLDPTFLKVQVQQAKNIVLKHFNGNGEAERSLQSIGVPSSWLFEAKAYRSSTKGDLFSYLENISQVDVKKARKAMEANLVPNILFMDNSTSSQCLSALDAISGPDDSLSKVVGHLLDINTTINSMGDCTTSQLKAELPALKEACDIIESTLTKVKSHLRSSKDDQLSLFSGIYTVDIKYFVSEAMRYVTLFRLQLLALENGKSIHGSLSELLLLRDNLKKEGAASVSNMDIEIDSVANLRAFL